MSLLWPWIQWQKPLISLRQCRDDHVFCDSTEDIFKKRYHEIKMNDMFVSLWNNERQI
jgi:hypothetical protein